MAQEDYQMLVDGFGDDFLCPVCRDRAMVHMLGDLQVTCNDGLGVKICYS